MRALKALRVAVRASIVNGWQRNENEEKTRSNCLLTENANEDLFDATKDDRGSSVIGSGTGVPGDYSISGNLDD